MDYPNNSNKFKEEQKHAATEEKRKVERVVTGPVKVKKKSGFRKFIGSIFTEDDADSVKSYIVGDVIIPAIKKGISETVNIILGGVPGQKTRSNVPKVSYRSYYDEPRYREPVQATPKYNYDDVVLETRGEAEEVLTQMTDLIDTYGLCSVADMYEMVGITGEYTDNNYGWTNLASASVDRVSGGGYMLKLPRPRPLKR